MGEIQCHSSQQAVQNHSQQAVQHHSPQLTVNILLLIVHYIVCQLFWSSVSRVTQSATNYFRDRNRNTTRANNTATRQNMKLQVPKDVKGNFL
jgi:hypothetical protein